MKTLELFRNVIVQDAALLMCDTNYNQHKIFKQPVFQSQEFKTFQEKIIEAESVSVPSTLSESQIYQEIRDLKPFINTMISRSETTCSQNQEKLLESVSALNNNILDFLQGNYII